LTLELDIMFEFGNSTLVASVSVRCYGAIMYFNFRDRETHMVILR